MCVVKYVQVCVCVRACVQGSPVVLRTPAHLNMTGLSTTERKSKKITSTLCAYEDGTASKFQNVGTESSDAGRLPQKTQYGKKVQVLLHGNA